MFVINFMHKIRKTNIKILRNYSSANMAGSVEGRKAVRMQGKVRASRIRIRYADVVWF